MKKIAIPAIFLAAILAIGSLQLSNVYGAGVTCPPDITSGTTNANVTVPAGQSCTIGGTAVINGNVKAEPGATLTISGSAVINGNVKVQ